MIAKDKYKPRLGRGLSSLISVSELPVEAEIPGQEGSGPSNPPAGVVNQGEIPLEAITPNPHQPRKQMDEAGIAALAASLKSTGLVQPIVVRTAGAGQYQLIAGERRWRAAKAAGLATIPAIVKDVDAFTQAQMALIENIHREDLNPVDRAQAYRMLMDQLGLTQAELATRLGEDRTSITHHLRLLDLKDEVLDQVRVGKLSLGHAKLLATVADTARQEYLANLVIAQELSVRNLERLIESGQATAATQPAKAERSAHIVDLERSITSQLGLRVQLQTGSDRRKGKLVIHYADLEQFDQLLERLGVRAE